MTSVVPQWTVLIAHPDTPREPVAGIAVEAQLQSADTLLCSFSLHGDVSRVRISGVGAGVRAEGLWQHTCFEAFVAADGVPGYYEFNFSPSLGWAAYQFAGYRAGMTPAPLAQAPGLNVRRNSQRLELAATVHLAGLKELYQARLLHLGLAAVIEDTNGRLSYWALEHAPGEPDFHQRDGFTLELRNA